MQKNLILILVLIANGALAQLNQTEIQQVDSIFSEWKSNNGPGVAGGLMFGDTIKYLKGFGLAEMETKTKITPRTKFQVAHLSRQFTVLAVLILKEQGKLSLNDLLRTHIPNLPHYKNDIQVKHLINHSTGLNDYNTVKVILGKEEDDIFTHEDAMRLICAQKEPNFKPGTAFSYIVSQTETTLMAELVANVSKMSFSKFVEQHVFEPAQMHNSTFIEDYNTLLSQYARSYQMENEELRLRKTNYGYAGPTNLYTTAEDLHKWYSFFNSPPATKFAILVQRLDEQARLENGDTFNSAWGTMTLGREFFHKERGLPCFWQYGISGGYAANVFRFPEQRLISFVLGNNNRYNGMPAMSMAYHFLEDEFPEPQAIDVGKLKTKKLSKTRLQIYEGHYWNSERAIARRLFVTGDTLYYARLGQEEGLPMIPLEQDNTFQLQVDSDDVIKLSFKEVGSDLNYNITLGESDPNNYERYTPITHTPKELEVYTGTFYAESLGVVYSLEVKDGKLHAYGPDGTHIEFEPVTKDVFRGQTVTFGSIVFQRDINNAVRGFTISTDGIQKLDFTKFTL